MEVFLNEGRCRAALTLRTITSTVIGVRCLFCYAIFALGCLTALVANAFTIQVPGFDPNHEFITADATSTLGFSFFSRLAIGHAVEAVDVKDYTKNRLYGHDPSTDVHHFDSGKIAEALAYVGSVVGSVTTGLWKKVQEGLHWWDVSRLGSDPRTQQLHRASAIQIVTNLGKILHANQDFYSHSNYVETTTFVPQAFGISGLVGLGDIPLWNRVIPPNGPQFVFQLVSGVFPDKDDSQCVDTGYFFSPGIGYCAIFMFGDAYPKIGLPDHEALNKDSSRSSQGARLPGAPVAVGIPGRVEPDLTLFDLAFDVAERQTESDLRTFLRLPGSPTGADFLNDLDLMPDLLAELTTFLDPTNPNFLANYEYAEALDVARDSGNVPAPPTLFLLLAGLGLMGFVARRRHQQAA